MPQPNILLICTDHWPAHLLCSAGNTSILTPTLDSLANNGVRFTNAYSECPVCVPARRSLMTGTTPRTHGDRRYDETLPLPPNLPTLAQTFRDHGYQAYAVGKLHTFPQRSRIGFDDVLLCEEGRTQYGVIDDYEIALAEAGHAGELFASGMNNNEYVTRPWHLPERLHNTNWTAHNMARFIQRRDPARPGFWYMSFQHPHPPLWPLQEYWNLYADIHIPDPPVASWAHNPGAHTTGGDTRKSPLDDLPGRLARRAFHALCTHIDHQIRVVIGTLRQQGLIDNTIIMFTSDHGDMLGTHRLWGKRMFYEPSANIPMLLMGVKDDPRVGHHRTDDRLVALQDVMPTLLDLAGIPIPPTVEGQSMLADKPRDYLYGEIDNGHASPRMIHDGRHKLIYHPEGNRIQLFDLDEDPNEMTNLADSPAHADLLHRLTQKLIANLYGGDEAWAKEGKLVGTPEKPRTRGVNRGLSGQRGLDFPRPPSTAELPGGKPPVH